MEVRDDAWLHAPTLAIVEDCGPNVPVSSGAASAPYAPAAGSDGRCPTCRQRNSRAGEREMDDGSVIVWHCNVPGCANHSYYPNVKVEAER